MKNPILHRFFLSGFVLAVAVFLASTVTANAQAVTPAKVAVVTSDAFYDAKAGLTRFIVVQKTLDTEFKTRRDELAKLQAQIEVIEKEIRDTAKIASAAAIAEKSDKYDSLKRDYRYKAEDAKKAFDKRSNDLMKPISDDVGKAMGDFAKRNGIDILIDVSKIEGVYVFNNAVDATAAFIAYFNAMPAKP